MLKIFRQHLLMASLSFWASYTLQAQTTVNTQVKQINKVYQEVRNNISRKKLGTSHFTFNLKRHNLHHSGYRHYSQKLYYNWQKEQVYLRLALVRSERGNVDYQKEFLFNQEGELVYFQEKQNDEKKYPYREVKVYFAQGKLLVWNQNQQNNLHHQRIQSPVEKVQLIMQEAKALQADLHKRIKEQ
ncbi:hypothetical protein [Microscilla marina]|nr:hypothetical protein [Microscilla marina]